jgi:3-methyladenine DNA glycosylase AlkD
MGIDYNSVFKVFEKNASSPEAEQMSAYMRGKFLFLGIPTPKRRALSRDLLKAAKKDQAVDWVFVSKCWKRPEREFQYLAVNYLNEAKDFLIPGDIEKLRGFAVTKSWWDTIDGLDKVVGHIAFKYPEIKKTLLAWSVDDNIWLRRIAIDHQLARKDKTDTALLAQIIENNLGQTEFFINKAIGWSLREYSKTNPGWVRNFIEKYRGRLAPLSIKEAGKYI